MTSLAQRERTMIRRCTAGGSDELFSAAQQQAIEHRIRQRLAELGSDFLYDEFYGRQAAN